MDVQFGPNAVDEPNLLYKIHHKLKVFNTSDSLGNRGYNLVASSSKYGILFVASPDGVLSTYHLKDLIDKENQAKSFKLKLPEKPTHIVVSCDHEFLAVTGGKTLMIYKVNDFRNMNISPVADLLSSVRNELNSFVCALTWNPCIPDTIAMALYDGTLIVSQVSNAQTKKIQGKARCICWSPKGKQLVVGNSDGTLCQYKPDLSPMKLFPAPNLFEGSPVEAMAVYWISTYQFAVVYKNATDNSRPAVTIVNTPKAGQATCLNYEDICYSLGSNRPWFYYLQGIAQWNLILASSSNSMEMASLGSGDGASWLQWCQTDEARPELPLTDKKQENYPVGVCIDTCAIHQLPWGENQTLPHMPLLHVVSQTGLLTIFNVINLNNQAAQVCTPPQPFNLPANALTSEIPGEPQSVVQAPAAPVAQKPQPVPMQPPPQIQAPQAQQITSQFGSGAFGSIANSRPFEATTMQSPPSYAPAPTTQIPVQKPQPEVKPITPSTSQPQVVQKNQSPLPTQLTPQTPEMKAALKAEQESANKIKIEQELKNMLIKEVNDFQMELYKFTVKTKDTQVQLQRELNSMEPIVNLQSLDQSQLRKDCSMEELVSAVLNLKLELVRACAIVAEARTHSEVKDLQEWTQTDPLTMKRVASIKNLSYYVQNQLERAQKALDFKWNELAFLKDKHFSKPGQRMIRPILDDVYQPLVKQQEILSRQQAVLKSLKKTLNECNVSPVFKSTSILRSTPFQKDPLSKLTKNILNMSLEPETKGKNSLTPYKLDALRDMLANHKPNKIKPANIEITQHLTAMRLSYQNSLKEPRKQQTPVKFEVTPQAKETLRFEVNIQPNETIQKTTPSSFKSIQSFAPPAPSPIIQEVKPAMPTAQPVLNIPSFTPVSNFKPSLPGFNNVARTLFTDEPQEPSKPIQQTQAPQIVPAQKPFAQPPQSAELRSALRSILQEKQSNQPDKSDGNLFMGQKICSPTSFGAHPPQATSPSNGFTAKPVADLSNMFNKFPPQSFMTESKPPTSTSKTIKSDETVESINPIDIKSKEEKQTTNLFGLKPIVTATSAINPNEQSKPLFAKSDKDETYVEKIIEKPKEPAAKPLEKVIQKLKENVPETVPATDKANNAKPFGVQSVNKPSIFGSNSATSLASATDSTSDTAEAKEVKSEVRAEPPKPTEEPKPPVSPTASSLFASANATSKPQSIFGSQSPTTQSSSIFGASPPATTSASSLFASAASSQPSSLFGSTKTTQAGSIFAAPTTSTTSVFGSNQGSIFGAANKSEGETKPSPASPTSVFGSSPAFPSSPTTTSTSVFGSSGSETTNQSIFATSSTTTQSVFGTSTTTTTQSKSDPEPKPISTQSSFFETNTAKTESSVFGTNTSTTQSSVFGTTTTQSSLFGTNTATTQSSVFGANPPSTQSSIFGSSTQTTQAPLFGGAATNQPSIFASNSTSPQSVFGSNASQSAFGPPATTQSSIFGAVPSDQATSQSVFGSSPQTTQASSVFGGQNTSVFGAPTTTAQSGSLFGSAESNLFAAASISTTSAPSQSTGGSIFGGGSPSSVFGGNASSGGNVFGAKASHGQSNWMFGGNTNQTGAGTFGQTPPDNNLWAGAPQSPGFGSPVAGQAATTQSSSVFGGSGGSFSSPGSAFGAPQQTSAFGAPAAESNTSVFGSPQQSSGGFGGSAVFGSKPAFGQQAGFGSPTSGSGFGSFGGFNKSPTSGFGSSATFGGGAAFGAPGFGNTSPNKMFGGGAPAPSFASPNPSSNATFESLATQNTMTFGNLAQQSGPVEKPAPTFNTSPSFTGWRS